MGPKGHSYAKPRCESTASDLCRVFKCNYSAVPVSEFSFKDDDFTVLDKQMDFFVDLWKADPYVSESVLAAGLQKAFPNATVSIAKAVCKDIRLNLSLIHTKKRSMTSGLKLPVLKAFLEKLPDDGVPLPIKQTSSSSKVEPQLGKAKSVAELYGFQSGPAEMNVSQYTISDASQPDVETNPKVVAKEAVVVPACQGSMVAPACQGYYFDYQEMALVRWWKDGSTETGKMKAGPNGFALAVFSDRSEQETTVSNLEMIFGKGVRKKPAGTVKKPFPRITLSESDGEDDDEDESVKSLRKRPAAQISPSASELKGVKKKPAAHISPATSKDTVEPVKAVEAKTVEEQLVEAKPGKALKHNIWELPSSCKLKLGLFSEKAYITSMAPDSDKWTLLINVGSDQAARNGKNHHAIMQQVWEHTKTLTDLPSKDEMRRLLLSLLDSV